MLNPKSAVQHPQLSNRPRLTPEALRRIVSECKGLQQSVGDFLSGERTLPLFEGPQVCEAPLSFEALETFPETDFASERHRILIALSQLSEYYPLGFNLELIEEKWYCELLFTNGEILELSRRREVHPQLVPDMSPLTVKCIATPKILSFLPLRLSGVEDCEETLLFRPTTANAVLVLTQLPRPWLIDMAEKTMSFLNRCFLP